MEMTKVTAMKNNHTLKLATAFSGGLAAPEFALKYENIDHEVIFTCEFDKYARKQYLEFHGEPNTFYEDIRDLDARHYKDKIDLFVWGSPCFIAGTKVLTTNGS